MGLSYHRNKRRRFSPTTLFCAVAATIFVSGAAQGVVEVNVTRVGFPALEASDLVRSGAWVPIVVDLALVEQEEFHGSIRVGQFDVDGDECYDRTEVHLRAATGGARRVTLYALSNELRNRGDFVVELFDTEGNGVEVRSPREGVGYQVHPDSRPATVADDDLLILSISTGAIGRVRDLATSDQAQPYVRQLHVGHMSPTELPELWIGLESVDAVVWDDARPEELTELQIKALLEWVRQGGTLLIAASRSVGSLTLTKAIDAVLPVDIGDLVRVDNLPDVRKALLGAPEGRERRQRSGTWWFDEPFARAVSVAQCTLRDGATRVPDKVDNESNVITRRRLGRGQVIFSAITLNDLFSAPGKATTFFQNLLQLSLLPKDTEIRPNPVTLFPQVVGAVAFTQRAGLYLALVGLCSVGYLFLATFGSWSLLGARGWRNHSWSAFAAVALAASLLAVFAVNYARGFGGETLHQLSIVDLDAGDAHGYATVYFGLKTGLDSKLDVWLPSEAVSATEPGRTNCFLRPIPMGNDPAELSATFADPEAYRLLPGSAVIDDVRIRGTLKRFEGRWSGPLGGTLTGEISVDNRLQIMDGSYIVNNLGVDLHDCYLLHTDQEFGIETGFRSGRIYAYPVGDLRGDGSKIDLVSQCCRRNEDENYAQFLQRSTLAEAQTRWGSAFRNILSTGRFDALGVGAARLGQEENALLLLSTLGEYDASQDAGMADFMLGVTTWSRDRCRQLDLRAQLQPGCVILLGFSDDPGPARLFRRTGDRPFRPLDPDPDRSWTMYRIRIPVTMYKPEQAGEGETTG